MIKKRISLIDGNSLGHAHHRSVKLTSGTMQTQAVFGMVRAIREMKAMRPHYEIIVLWDGRAQWRFDLHPDYKSNRTDDAKKLAEREAYKEQRPYIERALEALGIRQMTAFTHEADDLAGYLVKKFSNPETHIRLETGDGDWKQLIRQNVSWHDHRDDGKETNIANFFDKTGFESPYAFLEGKCLQGDSSDVIPGVGGIGAKGAPEFIAEFGSVRKFWQMCDSGLFVPKKKAHINLCSAEGRAAFGRNLRLMQLLKVEPPKRSDTVFKQGALDADKFTEVCEELAFGSILKNVDGFISPFKN